MFVTTLLNALLLAVVKTLVGLLNNAIKLVTIMQNAMIMKEAITMRA